MSMLLAVESRRGRLTLGDLAVMAGFEVAVELSLGDVGDVGTKLSGDCRARLGQRGAEHPPLR